mgnify:CR=1 FL=1
MSWDRIEYKEVAPCVCGKGAVIRLAYKEDDDWNRTREGIIQEEIACESCRSQYHIEHIVHLYSCPNWVGNGVSDKTYLVPNDLTIPDKLHEKDFCFDTEMQIVSMYSYADIKAAKADMVTNKYTTRLKLQVSQDIVSIYEKCYRKRSLPPIIDLLCKIERQYDKYEWTKERMSAYRAEEKVKIEENEREIADVIAQSVLLEFRRMENDKT